MRLRNLDGRRETKDTLPRDESFQPVDLVRCAGFYRI
jgi:hypothetical protein